MNRMQESSVSEFEGAARRHYDSLTRSFYLHWNADHLHLGIFESGECPGPDERLRDSPGLARAVERMVEATVAPAGIEEGHHVVDAGCGVGGTAIFLAGTLGCSVTGVNLSRVQMEMAGQKVIEAGLDDRIRFVYADCARSLPFADESIDVVVNIESACHYSNRERFLREVHRILKPMGRIAGMDWQACDGLTARQYEKYIQPLCEAWAMRSLECPTSYTRLLRETGFEVAEFEGFGGKEMDNLRIIENNLQLLKVLQGLGVTGPAFLRSVERISRLGEAWRTGCFDIGRYCAIKPCRD